MNHREKLEQLALEKQKLIAALNEIEGAMKYAVQCLNSEQKPEESLPLNKEALETQSEKMSLKSKA
tara:strand:+ start:488 stop:685 length:198 start_codon:yes stop_codon:yes gene_type:complete